MKLTPVFLLPLLAAGCSGSFQAPLGSTLTVPGDIFIGWDASYNEMNDDAGAVFWADIGVTDDAGMPLERIEVEVNSGYGGIYFVPESVILTKDPPAGWNSEDESFYEFSAELSADGYAPTYTIGETDRTGVLRVYGYIDQFPCVDTACSPVQLQVSIGVASDVFYIWPSL